MDDNNPYGDLSASGDAAPTGIPMDSNVVSGEQNVSPDLSNPFDFIENAQQIAGNRNNSTLTRVLATPPAVVERRLSSVVDAFDPSKHSYDFRYNGGESPTIDTSDISAAQSVLGAMATGAMPAAAEGSLGVLGGRMTDKPYDIKWDSDNNIGTFTSKNGNNYYLKWIDHPESKTAYASFFDKNYETALNNAEPGAAQKVLTTVLDGIKQKVAYSSGDINKLVFYADSSEPSRVRLYRAMANRLKNGEGSIDERKIGNDVRFTVPVSPRVQFADGGAAVKNDGGIDDWITPSDNPTPTPSSGVDATAKTDSGPDDWINPDTQPPSVLADVGKSIPAGLARGAADVLGTPGSVMGALDWAAGQTIGRAENLVKEGKIESKSPSEMQKRIDAEPLDIQALTPQLTLLNMASKYLNPSNMQSKIENVTGPLYESKTAPGKLVGAISEVLPATLFGPEGLGAKFAQAVGQGTASEVASDILPQDSWAQPYARLLGGVGGGLAAGKISSAVSNARLAMSDVAAEREAALSHLRNSQNPEALRDAALNYDPAAAEIVPGSKPTSDQAFGDIGLSNTARAVNTKDPVLFTQNEFGTGSSQQNKARSDYLNSIQDTGNPMDAVKEFQNQLNNLDSMHAQQELLARNVAEGEIGRIPRSGSPDDVGEANRQVLADNRANIKIQERRIANNIDPDGTITVNATPIIDKFNKIYSNLPPAAEANLSEPEKTLADLVSNTNNVEPIRNILSLRSELAKSMREERYANGVSPAYARMTGTMSGVQDVINNVIARRGSAASKAAGVPPVGVAAQPVPNAFVQPNITQDTVKNIRKLSKLVAQRAQTFDQGTVGDILRSGTTADSYRMPTSSVPGNIFQSGPNGAKAAQDFRAAVNMSPNLKNANQVADNHLNQAAALSFRREVLGDSDLVDLKKAASWNNKYQDALREVPASSQLNNATSASQAVSDIMAGRRQALENYQKGIVGKFMGYTDPDEVTDAVGRIIKNNDVASANKIMSKASNNPNAVEGIRKSAADFIVKNMTSINESGVSGVKDLNTDSFRRMVKDKRAALDAIMSREQMDKILKMDEDLTRGARSYNAVRVKASPNTAADYIRYLKNEHGGEKVSLLRAITEGAIGGAEIIPALMPKAIEESSRGPGALVGAAIAYLSSKLKNTLKDSGYKRVADIVRDSVADPLTLQAIMKRVPKGKLTPGKIGTGHEISLATRLATLNQLNAMDKHKRKGE